MYIPISLLLLFLSVLPSSLSKKSSKKVQAKRNVKDKPWSEMTPLEKSTISPSGTLEKTMVLRGHSLYAPYVDADLQNRWFDFGGSTIVNTNRAMMLTQDKPSQQGWIWSRNPLSSIAFQIEVEFRVDGKGNSLYGDGFAIWFTKERAKFGPVFGSADNWEGLGIFFDTYANARQGYTFPLIMGMDNDGTKSYDVANDGYAQESGHCAVDFRRAEITAKVRISYIQGKFLEVELQHQRWDEWIHCFTIWDYQLIKQPYLGFTAHTGSLTDSHDIISVSAHNIVYHPSSESDPVSQNYRINANSKVNRKPVSPESAGILARILGGLLYLLKWMVVIGLVAIVLLSVRAWRVNKNNKRF